MEELEEPVEERGAAGSPAGVSAPREGARRAVLLGAVLFLVALFYLFSPFLLVIIGWFLEPFSDVGGATAISHRVHEVTFGLLFGLALMGALAQVRRPERNVAGMQQTLVAVIAFLIVSWSATGFEPVSLAYLIPVLVAVVAHPERSKVLLPRGRPNGVSALMAAISVLPLVGLARGNWGKAMVGAQGHQSHWGTMAAFAITLLALVLLLVLRQPGWRVTAVSVALCFIGYAAASIVFPFDSSARPDSWAFLAIAWAAALLVVALRRVTVGRAPSTARTLVGLAAPVGALLVTLVWSTAWSPPRIPHQVAVDQLDRQGCWSCHLEANIAETGATVTPHPNEVCVDDPDGGSSCIGGQRDCLACHRLGENAVTAVRAWTTPVGGPTLPTDVLATVRGW